MNSCCGRAGPACGCLIAVLQSALLLLTFPCGLEGQRSQQNAAQASGGEIALGWHRGHLAGGDRSNKPAGDGRHTRTHTLTEVTTQWAERRDVGNLIRKEQKSCSLCRELRVTGGRHKETRSEV